MSLAIQSSQNHVNEAARHMWPAERKVELVLQGIRGQRPVADLCREAGISRTCYYRWRQQFMEAARTGLAHSEAGRQILEKRIQLLEAENINLRTRVRLFKELSVVD